MLYRKSSPNPPRLLLRIVATASASALVAACSSDAAGSVPGTPSDSDAQLPNPAPGPCGGGPCGSVAMPAADAGEASVVGGGSAIVPDSGHDARLGCGNGGVCGVVVMLPDASEASVVGGGVLPSPDSGIEAGGACSGHPCGVMAYPEAGFD